ncbi:MAG: S-layer homology domain-containing protein, partial [Clostridia bacterium]|nr:S-layer homology domain-containing protein [Clostridia bacterium]
MKNKILALILSVVMIAGVLVFPVSSADGSLPFKDVKEGKWFYKSVRFVYENGYMNGITSDTFDPNGNLTRGMVVTILCRMDGGTPELTDAFSDVAPKKWYAGYVGWAAKNKLVNGYSDGTFKPEANITRQEMAAVISRYIEYAGINMPRRFTAPSVFADDSKIAKWAKTYMEDLRRAGIFNGDTNGNCNPKSQITR